MDDERIGGAESAVHEALGESDVFLDFQERLSRVAQVERPVLIVGERGTGKELAASRLHYLSKRWEEPLVALNCASLSPTLIESELFGHEAGAFTGATRLRQGRFEEADAGTLFLDELGNIPTEVQEKILRVVEYGTFERVGGSRSIGADVRIVGATNADLVAMSHAGTFKEDLLDRLSFEVLFLPPLRERREDVMLLAHHFAARMSFELGRDELPEFSEAVVGMLEGYAWPGNVRELKNVAERAVYQSDSPLVERVVLDPFQSPYALEVPVGEPIAVDAPVGPTEVVEERGAGAGDFPGQVEALERRLLREGLRAARFNQRKAAAQLGLSYHQFRGLYRKYGVADDG